MEHTNAAAENEPLTARFTEHFSTQLSAQSVEDANGTDAPIPAYEYPEHPVHRLSNKERPFSPVDIASSLPQTYKRDEEEKEVALPPVEPAPYEPPSGTPQKRRRICGFPCVWVLLLGAVILAIAVGLGVGLGVGLTRSKSLSSSDSTAKSTYKFGGALNSQFYSTHGAFNGSGIALAQQLFSQSPSTPPQGSLVMYYQHYTGDIRWKRLTSDGQWLGGEVSEIVVAGENVRNGTALSAVSYVENGSSVWHVFFVSNNGTLRQKSNSNTTNIWTNGPLDQLDLKVLDADRIGMQACYYGNDYGVGNYIHTPLPDGNASQNNSGEAGMHLWYASNSSTFQQVGYQVGDSEWHSQGQFTDKNGYAGVACYSWGPGTVRYLMLVNQQNSLEVWWKDTNTSLISTTSHPVNQWVNSSISIDNVYPATSLGYTNVLYAQNNSTKYFDGYNISWAAENTTIVRGPNNYLHFNAGTEPALPGSHLSVSALPTSSGGQDLAVFYQAHGSDISEYTRDFDAGPWSAVPIDIP